MLISITPMDAQSSDLNNDWKGEVQIMWGIGKPVDVDEGMMFAFTKIKEYMLDYSEGWFFRCDNINTEKDPEKLNRIMLPESQNGLHTDSWTSDPGLIKAFGEHCVSVIADIGPGIINHSVCN